jgi:YidC/Oxa1 family membrane protein insertase
MQPNNKNILLATTLSAFVLLAWTWLYEAPRIEEKEARRKVALAQRGEIVTEVKPSSKRTLKPLAKSSKNKSSKAVLVLKDRETILERSKKLRIEIKSDALHGSIFLKGARLDDLTLARYFETQKKEKEVVLFAPAESKERYFADFGWISSNSKLDLPNPNTIWKSDSSKLTPQNPITLSWKNKQNIKFKIKISLDENYMFNIAQSVKNTSNGEISLASYGRTNRILNKLGQSNYILHEGAIGVFNGALQEIGYSDLIEEKNFTFNDSGENKGFTDKYWSSSLIPDRNLSYSSNFSYEFTNQNSLYSSEFFGQEFIIPKGETLEFNHNLFAGAKKVKLLDQYAEDYNIKLFDRAIDFGWFYFLTKPFFFIIDFFHTLLGNFGLAILAMTVLIKLVLFPMANKSYTAIGKIKKLQPKIVTLRERFKDDKLALNREMMELYKKEKVNPASGCLPIIVQIPVFFALYKVLFVTLDMRHASFYGWIKDLSAPDPTSLFNLFGLLPFEVSGPFAIGVWPILMGLTMMVQQKLSPTGGDATQAKILKWMPFVLTFVLAAFPAGLVIYWTWSNTLSILQQWVITRKMNKEA